MAFNGSGVFNRLYSWIADRNAGVKILAERMDQEMDGFATGLSNTITRDGQSTVTADIGFNNRKITGLGDATEGGHALNRSTGDGRYSRRQAVTDKSANYTALAADIGTPFRVTASATLSLTAAATLGNRWHCIVIADGGDVTIDPDGSETINGSATLVVPDGGQTEITCDGSRFFALDVAGDIETAVDAALVQARADIASATTTDIGAESTQYLRVTGTVDIEGLGTAPAGVVRDLLFADALTLTHNATSLILPGGDDITTAAGDVALFRSEGSGNWRCVRYSKADGTAVVVAAPEIIQSDVRQTVNTGPVDSDGRADFLAAGTGLEVVTTGLTTDTLNLTMGDGFGPRGKVDLSFEVDSNLSWGSLPDDTDPIYLYLEWDGSTLSTGSSTLAPEYSLAKPSSPSSGQYWYPTDHRSRGERWDGSAWVPVYRVYVGECVTSGGSVVDVTSYAYQGRSLMTNTGFSGNGTLVSVHNLGVTDIISVSLVAEVSATEKYYFGIYAANPSSSNRWVLRADSRNSVRLNAESGSFSFIKADGSASSASWNSVTLQWLVERSF